MQQPLTPVTKRPKKPRSALNFSLRLTMLERTEIAKRALAAGLSMSAYIRSKALEGAEVVRKVRHQYPIKDHVALLQALALLGQTRIPNNLNQIAHAINSNQVTLLTPRLEAQIIETCDHVKQIRTLLLKALGKKVD